MIGMSLLDLVYRFKTAKCTNCHDENWNDSCAFFHSEKDMRRASFEPKTGKIHYLNILFLPGITPEEQKENFAQNLTEFSYHIQNYKTQPCTYLEIMGSCSMQRFCPYIHPEDNLEELNKYREKLAQPTVQISTFSNNISPMKFQDSPEKQNGKPKLLSQKKDKKGIKFMYKLENGEEVYVYGNFLKKHLNRCASKFPRR